MKSIAVPAHHRGRPPPTRGYPPPPQPPRAPRAPGETASRQRASASLTGGDSPSGDSPGGGRLTAPAVARSSRCRETMVSLLHALRARAAPLAPPRATRRSSSPRSARTQWSVPAQCGRRGAHVAVEPRGGALGEMRSPAPRRVPACPRRLRRPASPFRRRLASAAVPLPVRGAPARGLDGDRRSASARRRCRPGDGGSNAATSAGPSRGRRRRCGRQPPARARTPSVRTPAGAEAPRGRGGPRGRDRRSLPPSVPAPCL